MCLEVRKQWEISTIPRILMGFCGRGGAGARVIFIPWGQSISCIQEIYFSLYCTVVLSLINRGGQPIASWAWKAKLCKVELQRCMLDLLRWLLIFLPGRRVFDILLNNLFCNWTKEKMFELFLRPRQTPRCYTGIEYTNLINFILFSKR